MSFTKFGFLEDDYDNEPIVYGINPSNISHTQLQDIGVNTHPEIDDHINSDTNPHGENLTQTNLTCDTINAINTDPLILGGGVKFPNGINSSGLYMENTILDSNITLLPSVTAQLNLHSMNSAAHINLSGNPAEINFYNTITSNHIFRLNGNGFTKWDDSTLIMKARLDNDIFSINTINEVYNDSGVTIDGCLIKDGTVDGVDIDELHTNFNAHVGSSFDPHGTNLSQTTLDCSTINERVLDAGVIIDGCLIKDGTVDGVDVSQLESNFNAHVGASFDPHGTTLTQTTLACSTINERVPEAGVTIDGCLIKDGTVDGVDVSQLQSDTAAHILNSVNPHGVTLTQTTLNCSTINEAASNVGVIIDGTHIKDNTINLGGTFKTSEIPIYTFRNNESRVYLESNGADHNTLMLTNNARTKGFLFGLNDAGNVYLDGGSGIIILSNQATFSDGGSLPSYTPSVNAAMLIYNSNLVTFPSGIKTGFDSSIDSTTIHNFFEILETSTTTQQPWDDPQDVKLYIQKINVTVSITVIGFNLGTANATGANILLTGVIPLHCRPLSQVEQPFLVVDNHDFRLGKIIVHTNGNLEFAPAYFTPGEKFTNDSGIFQQSVRYPIV